MNPFIQSYCCHVSGRGLICSLFLYINNSPPFQQVISGDVDQTRLLSAHISSHSLTHTEPHYPATAWPSGTSGGRSIWLVVRVWPLMRTLSVQQQSRWLYQKAVAAHHRNSEHWENKCAPNNRIKGAADGSIAAPTNTRTRWLCEMLLFSVSFLLKSYTLRILPDFVFLFHQNMFFLFLGAVNFWSPTVSDLLCQVLPGRHRCPELEMNKMRVAKKTKMLGHNVTLLKLLLNVSS